MIWKASIVAGSAWWTLSSIEASSLPFASRSRALIASQLRSTSPEVAASSSAKTCGWRRTIFSDTRSMTVSQAEGAALLGDARVEDDLQQQVAQLARSSSSSFSSIAWATS